MAYKFGMACFLACCTIFFAKEVFILDQCAINGLSFSKIVFFVHQNYLILTVYILLNMFFPNQDLLPPERSAIIGVNLE